MSNQTVSVPNTATPTLINPGLPSGTIIYNQDANNTVWISSNPSVAAGSGIPLGPLGSMSWKGGAVYAIADGGAVGNTLLNMSSDVGTLDNPVAIGAAVAAQLLTQGVPNVLVGDLFNYGGLYATVNLDSLGGNKYGILNMNVSAFASVTITINPQSASQISATFKDGTTANNALGGIDFPISTANGGSITFVLPVTGPRLDFVMTSSTNQNAYSYSMYGSNRVVDRPRIVNGYSQAMQTFWSGFAFNFAQRYDASFPFVSNGKSATIRMVVTGSGVGKFGYLSFDGNGAITQVDMIDSATGAAGTDGKEIERDITLPPGRLQLYWFSNIGATYTVVFNITQQTN